MTEPCGRVCGIPKDEHQTEEHPWAEAASLDSDELRKLRAIEKAARDLNMTMPDLGDGDPMSDLDDALADYDEWLDAQDRALLSAGDNAEAPRAATVFVLLHGGDYDEGDTVMGVYGSRAAAEYAQHSHMRARNKDGSVSFRTNDPRPKIRTFDGCDSIEEHAIESVATIEPAR